MRHRVLILEPHDDVRMLLELSMERLGYEPVAPTDSGADEVDAVVLEPSWSDGHKILGRLAGHIPPVICLSIYPRESGLAPLESVAYLTKPSSLQELSDALRTACSC